jgi:hypothetical protein
MQRKPMWPVEVSIASPCQAAGRWNDVQAADFIHASSLEPETLMRVDNAATGAAAAGSSPHPPRPGGLTTDLRDG